MVGSDEMESLDDAPVSLCSERLVTWAAVLEAASQVKVNGVHALTRYWPATSFNSRARSRTVTLP